MIAALTGLLVIAGAAASTAQSAAPDALIREVLEIEDRIVAGDPQALAERSQMLASVAARMRSWPVEVWRKPANGRALIVCALIGGDPTALRTAMERGGLGEFDKNLTRGTLAYAEGDAANARSRLLAVDVSKLGGLLAVAVAMAQSTLMGSADVKAVLAKLDDVRLLAPGTLFEDSALRRRALLLLDHGELTQSLATVARYLRRFQNSVLAASFRDQVLTELAGRAGASATQKVSAVRSQVTGLPVQAQAELLMDLAKRGFDRSDLELAKVAAAAAESLAGDGSRIESRAKLLLVASTVAEGGGADPSAVLRELPETHLEPDEIALRRVTIDLAASIYAPASAKEAGGSVADGGTIASAPAPSLGEHDAADGHEPTAHLVKALEQKVSAALRDSENMAIKAEKNELP